MKDDLIKRSDVLNLLDEMYKQEKDLMRSIWVRDSIKSRIEEMPTAYDMDKIVEELESKLTEKKYQHEDEDYFAGICDAIEIVKGGRQ